MPRSIPTLMLLAVSAAAMGGIGARAAAADAGPAFPRAQLERFATEVAHRDGLDRRATLAVLMQARPQPGIVQAISHPVERVLQWWQYRRIFVTDRRIADGVEFWREHRDALERVSAQEGVPPQYIIAILGAESNYGRITGSYRVLDALATLTFDYPPRSRFFGRELEQFLVLAHREKLDPLTVKGSYAGAMGPLQFMPSAYLRYAVDRGSHTRLNLFSDWGDIFLWVARFLHECGWQAGGPVMAHVKIEPGATFHVDPNELSLDQTIGDLSAQGVRVESDAPGGTRVVLLLAQEQDGPSYRVGFNNFHALTRYNHSALYAMAIDELAHAIALRLTPAGPDSVPARTPAAAANRNADHPTPSAR
ncbi:MAG TPA: lytic murein transglycosylase B [Steroidobacteraceae bacterium]|nr:lytic murein transglycosylase B [Steroidobacteraceae bacterium]